MDPAAGTTLEYDRARPATPMVALHYVALVCALGPMIVGVLTFLLYVATRHELFALLGFLTLFGGCAATFVGGVCLGVYWFQAGRANADDAAIARRNAKRDLVLTLVNFPLAGVLTFAGLAIIERQTSGVGVVVHNVDAVAAHRVTLDTGADRRDLGPLSPGASDSVRIRFGDQGLRATLVRSSGETSHQIFDHMDSDTVSTSDDLRLVIRNGRVEEFRP